MYKNKIGIWCLFSKCLIILLMCLMYMPTTSEADTVTYNLKDVHLGSASNEMTGSFEWTYNAGDFEGGSGLFTDLYIPWHGSDFSDLVITIEPSSIEFSLDGNFHDHGLDITLFLLDELSETNSSSSIDTTRSEYHVEVGTSYRGSVVNGSIDVAPELSWIEIVAEKRFESNSEHYNFEFDFDGMPVDMDNVERFLLMVPNGNIMIWQNSLLADDYTLSSEKMTLADFESRFPAGVYTVRFFPFWLGSLRVIVPHDFPETPVITFPIDDATEVSLEPVITWSPMTNIDELTLEIEDFDDSTTLEIRLQTNTTSFTIPSGFLQPNSGYELILSAHRFVNADPYEGSVQIVGGMNSELISSQSINFTTAP